MESRTAFIKNSVLWTLLFFVLVIAPLALAAIGHQEEYRGFWIEFGVGLGFVGLAMMGLQFVLTARYNKIGAPFGLDELLNFHGQAGYFAWLFILGHFIILFIANTEYIHFLNPAENLPRSLALFAVIIALTCLIAFTHWREKIGIVYEWWRVSHGILALFVVFIGLVHILQVSFYVTEWWQKALWSALTIGAMGMLIHTRVWRPYKNLKKPYIVTEVKQETENIWSLILQPYGHKGMRFKAGQFAWITFGDSPFKLQQHPFTMSSPPEVKDKIRFTIKKLGDFTSEIDKIKNGSTAFIEGPYGNFTLDVSSAEHNIFIAGGIGITPLISMLESINLRNNPLKFTLIYGTPSIDKTPFYEDLKSLSESMNLKVVHVFEEPPADWKGETGFITEEIIKKYIPDDVHSCEYFICGPPPMMDVAEKALREWGLPVYKVHSERYKIV
ncbi:MAG: ferric reductase-like transmembrane domain-containing protein [Balneolaceae bacterium]